MAKKTNILSFDEARRSGVGSSRVPSLVDGFGGSSSRSRNRSASRSTGMVALYGPDDYEQDCEEDEEYAIQRGASKKSASRSAQAKKRNRTKKKAEARFNKQYGSDSSAPSEGAPRAALYKGQMGTKHKQAARMQQNATKSSSKRGFGAFGVKQNFIKAPVVLGTIIAVLALSWVFLYQPAKDLYVVSREHDQLQAEYAALEQRNARLAADVADLQTQSGVEARAHEELGWIKEGEETANVRGLDLEEVEDPFVANVVAGSVPPPQTWYSPFLDVVFGVGDAQESLETEAE